MKAELAADQRLARLARQFAIGVVGEVDAAFGVAQHDQVALRFEQAADALLGFLQFPVAVGQRFIVERDLAKLVAQQAHPEAQGRERETGESEQKTRADRKGVGVVTGIRRPAAGDEAVRAAERGGKNHEGADREDQPRMAPGKAAQM